MFKKGHIPWHAGIHGVIKHPGGYNSRGVDYVNMKLKEKEHNARYRKTPFGYIANMVSNQKKRSKLKGFPPPEWTTKDLYVYCMNNVTFLKLFENWVRSGYQLKFAPSIDRRDNDLPYRWDNIQFMTASQNKSKHNQRMEDWEYAN